jgi:hypothetical protein
VLVAARIAAAKANVEASESKGGEFTPRQRMYLRAYLIGAQQREASAAKDSDRTIALLDEQIKLLRDYSATDDSDTVTKQQLGLAYISKGTEYLLDKSEPAKAIEPLQQGIAVLEQESKKDVADLRLVSNLGRSYTHLGNAQLKLQSNPQALEAYTLAASAFERSLLGDTRAHVKRHAAEAYWRYFSTQNWLGNQKEAALAAKRFVAFAKAEEALFKQAPAADWLKAAQEIAPLEKN